MRMFLAFGIDFDLGAKGCVNLVFRDFAVWVVVAGACGATDKNLLWCLRLCFRTWQPQTPAESRNLFSAVRRSPGS